MRVHSRVIAGWARAVTLVLGIALSASGFAASPVLDRIVEKGVLTVAMTGDQQPFNFVYGKKETLMGFDVDLAEALAGIMKVRLEISRMPFDKLLAALEAGEADMVISGMTITPERSRKASFVGPYMLSGKSLLSTEQFVKKHKTSADFNNPKVRLAALKGSTSERLIQRDLSQALLTPVGNYDEGVQLLLAGKVDGLVADVPILALTKRRYPTAGLQMIMPPLDTEPLGIAIAADDEQLENLLRNYLAVLTETGQLVRLHKKWF
jgi:polar amino acid transport system substrate-binding protein